MNFPSDESRFKILNSYEYLFQNATQTAGYLFRATGDSIYLKNTFDLAEKSSACTFLQLHHRFSVADKLDMPDSLIQRERILSAKSKLLTTNANVALANIKEDEWVQTHLDYEEIRKEIIRKYPQYYFLESNLELPSIKEIQQSLTSNKQVVLKYFLTNDRYFIFYISSQKVHLIEKMKSNDFTNTISETVSFLRMDNGRETTQEDVKQFVMNANKLYEWLVKPVDSLLNQGDQLIIIPDKVLSYLPFEVLLGTTNETSNLNALPYLIKSYSISYSYSTAMLNFTRKFSKESKFKNNYLGVGPGINNHNTIHDASIEEIEQANLIWNGKTLLRENAIKRNFFNNAKQSRIVHIAAHSALEEEDPSTFAILLNSKRSELVRDSIMMNEIYTADIPSDLVILSGCETANGPIRNGEGIVSLSHAFSYAGAKSITCSLWKTENKVSSQIITSYHKYLQSGKEKDEAMRQAKLDFLVNADNLLSHPFFWAPFINIGNQEALSYTEETVYSAHINNNLFYLVVALIIFILLVINLIQNKSHKKVTF